MCGFRREPMATIAQIEANRLNAQKSTGPTSVDGKAHVRFNALKHGIDARSLTIPGEDPAGRAALEAEYYQQFQPQGVDEAYLVETLIESDWVQRRLAVIETGALRILLEDPSLPAENKLGALFLQNSPGTKVLDKLFRRQQAAHRDYFRALKELQHLQKERLAAREIQPPAAVPENRVCSTAPESPQPSDSPDALHPVPVMEIGPATPLTGSEKPR